jgi:hypothetical protein
MAIINVMKINGMNTMSQEMMPKPWIQSAFSKKVINAATIAFINAVLYRPLIESIIICVIENNR